MKHCIEENVLHRRWTISNLVQGAFGVSCLIITMTVPWVWKSSTESKGGVEIQCCVVILAVSLHRVVF